LKPAPALGWNEGYVAHLPAPGHICAKPVPMRNILITALLLTTIQASAQYPAVWPTFGNNGLILGDMATGSAEMGCSVLQPDGKLLVGGTGGEALTYYATIIRIDTVCGTLDSTFGNNGERMVTFEQRTRMNDLALQPDGKIIGCGMIAPDNIEDSQWPGVFRLHPDGSVDTSFNHTGYVRMQLNGQIGDFIQAFPTDTTILCLGITDGGAFAAVRFLYDGTIDTSFADNGFSYQYLPNWSLHYENAGIRSASGAYLACAIFCDTNVPGCYSFGLAKYLHNGEPDTTFGNNGVTTTGMFARTVDDMGLAELPDGRILLGGNTDINLPNSSKLMVCLMPDGSLDTSFGSGGSSLVPDDGSGHGSGLVALADGSTLQFGRRDGTGGCFMRDADGQVVTAFGSNGFLGLGGYSIDAGHRLPSGRVIAMGWDFGTNTDYALAGLTPDPVADGLPVITQNATELACSGTGAFQWYFNGNAIPGETNATHTPAQNGTYTVTLTRSADCVYTSAPFQLLNVGITEASVPGVRLMANPVQDMMMVRNDGAAMPYTLTSASGGLIAQGQLPAGISSIRTGHLAQGVYVLAWSSPAGTGHLRVVKQ
jgi:uncharacterized delta-60 repeat protein